LVAKLKLLRIFKEESGLPNPTARRFFFFLAGLIAASIVGRRKSTEQSN